MKRYDKFKPSGIDWIGDIPEHWELKKLKFVGKTIIGITYSPDDITIDESGILVLRSSNIQSGNLTFDDCVFVDKEIQPKHYTRDGDILICARNGSAHLVGKSALITKEHEGHSFGAFMSVFRSQYGRFLYYFFNSQIFKAQTGLFSTSTINQLTSDTLNNMFIAYPPDIEEQTAIADFLKAKLAQFDKLISTNDLLFGNSDRKTGLLQEYKDAIIGDVITGKIKVF